MKKHKKTLADCVHSPTFALGIVRFSVGLFFGLFGLMKLMGFEGFRVEMMVNNLGLVGIYATAGAWLVVLTELVGGIVVLLGKIVPNVLYKLSLLGFMTIDVVAWANVHAGDPKQWLWHGLVFFTIVALLYTKPMCPGGITGHKEG